MTNNVYLIALLTLIGAFVITYSIIPKIIWIVNSRNLIDQPDFRSSHKQSTPTMAGFSFFLTLIMIVFFLKNWDSDGIGINFIAAVSLVFAIGLKDDLVLSSPKAKLLGQITAVSFVLFCSCFEITSYHGFLGIQELPTVISSLFVGFIMLTIINAYNLVDGIDGLASSLGIVIIAAFAILFLFVDEHFYFLLSVGIVGMLLAYLRFNFSATKKIFMGDTGSLIIGFCIAFFSAKFLAMDESSFSSLNFKLENKLLLIFSFLSVPFGDTARVMGIRILNKKSPFEPDRNHIHHILIDSKLPHYKVTLFLSFLNIAVIGLFAYLSFHFNSFAMLGFIIVFFILFLIVFNALRKNITSKNSTRRIVKFVNLMF